MYLLQDTKTLSYYGHFSRKEDIKKYVKEQQQEFGKCLDYTVVFEDSSGVKTLVCTNGLWEI